MDFVLIFPPLPKETKEIHLLESDHDELNTYYISLEKKMLKPHFSIKSPATGWEWTTIMNGLLVYTILFAVMDNRFYQYEAIRQKGKSMLLTLKDDRAIKWSWNLPRKKEWFVPDKER